MKSRDLEEESRSLTVTDTHTHTQTDSGQYLRAGLRARKPWSSNSSGRGVTEEKTHGPTGQLEGS